MEILAPKGLSAPAPGYIHVDDHNIKTSSSLKLLGQSKPNFMWSILGEGGMKVYLNGQGHMTKMATMAINSKMFKNLLLQNQKAYDFETWCEAYWNEVLQILYKS